MFHHWNIHKYTWTSPEEKTHNQTDHILIDRWHLSILDVWSFTVADCDTDHYLVVAKVIKRLAVSKKAAQKFGGERFNLKKLNELEVMKQYHIETPKKLCSQGELKWQWWHKWGFPTLLRLSPHDYKCDLSMFKGFSHIHVNVVPHSLTSRTLYIMSHLTFRNLASYI